MLLGSFDITIKEISHVCDCYLNFSKPSDFNYDRTKIKDILHKDLRNFTGWVLVKEIDCVLCEGEIEA